MPELMLSGEPDSASKYYWVKVGVSNFDMFRTTHDFFIEPKAMKIYYWDQFEQSDPIYLVSLQQWRYWRRKPGWNKPHTFKNGKLVLVK